MATGTLTIDSQVHAYERDRPERPWAGTLQGPAEVTGDDMVAAMDAVGVDGALLISPFTMYRYDASYALEVYAKHPTRFGLIRPFDPDSETIDEDIAQWTGTPGVVGARIMLSNQEYEADHPGLNAILAAGGRVGVPVNVMCSTRLPLFRELALRNPGTRMVVRSPGYRSATRAPAAARTVRRPAGRAVAGRTGQRSHQDFPGLARCRIRRSRTRISGSRCAGFSTRSALSAGLWGTDWTRAVNSLTYEQGVEAFRVTDQLSEDERSVLMGGTLAKIYNWSPGAAA